MKIAIINKYQNKVFRGAETFVYELGKRLSKDNKVDIISNVNYFNLFKKKYDVIIPTNGRCQVIIVRLISWLTGAKMIVSGQSGMGWDDKVNLYSFPNAFVALSPRALAWAKKVNPFVKCIYIPNGVDLERFKNIDYRLKNNTKTVLAVGAFTEQKRLNLAIDAVSKLNNVKLVIAGGGGDKRQEIIDYGLKVLGADRFKAISVPYEKMPEVYRAADVFTLPSRPSESFGNVLTEAMASGIPVVATKDPIRANIVGDAGILVDPEDTKAYAAGLAEALKKDWGDKPREQAKKFSWDAIAEKYAELTKSLL